MYILGCSHFKLGTLSNVSFYFFFQASPQSPLEHFHAFRHAISWSEPFILCLLAFQVFMFCSSIYVSRKERGLTLRLIVMISIAALVRGAESLNHWASRHWAQFATQNYFDKKGIFVSVMVCAPLLLDSLIMLLFFLREASQLLVQVKTAQLKKQRKQSQNSKKADDKKATGTSTGAASKRSKKTKKED
jgi:transmembrane protein 18